MFRVLKYSLIFQERILRKGVRNWTQMKICKFEIHKNTFLVASWILRQTCCSRLAGVACASPWWRKMPLILDGKILSGLKVHFLGPQLQVQEYRTFWFFFEVLRLHPRGRPTAEFLFVRSSSWPHSQGCSKCLPCYCWPDMSLRPGLILQTPWGTTSLSHCC